MQETMGKDYVIIGLQSIRYIYMGASSIGLIGFTSRYAQDCAGRICDGMVGGPTTSQKRWVFREGFKKK